MPLSSQLNVPCILKLNKTVTQYENKNKKKKGNYNAKMSDFVDA
jgi:hypothetical protein